jgi:hypothetical protein
MLQHAMAGRYAISNNKHRMFGILNQSPQSGRFDLTHVASRLGGAQM